MKIEDKRFYLDTTTDGDFVIKDRENDLIIITSLKDATYMLNKLVDENTVLKHHLLFVQKDDNDGLRVWQTPPLSSHQRITYGSEPK